MKKTKLSESLTTLEAINNINKRNFNILLGGDLNTGFRCPCLINIFENVGHSGLLFISPSAGYSHLIYSKNTGVFNFGENETPTVATIYADANGYIHIKNTNPAREIVGTYRIAYMKYAL